MPSWLLNILKETISACKKRGHFMFFKTLCSLVFWPLVLSGLIFAGCLALWRDEVAPPQRTCVTCLQRWTLSNQPWQSSTLSIKSCWDHSCTDRKTKPAQRKLCTIKYQRKIAVFCNTFDKMFIFSFFFFSMWNHYSTVCFLYQITSLWRKVLSCYKTKGWMVIVWKAKEWANIAKWDCNTSFIFLFWVSVCFCFILILCYRHYNVFSQTAWGRNSLPHILKFYCSVRSKKSNVLKSNSE